MASSTDFSNLKQDCRIKIWEYLPSPQLFACISSLKSSPLLRELSIYVLKTRAPFSLVQETDNRDVWAINTPDRASRIQYGIFHLKDRCGKLTAVITFSCRKGLRHSPIFELIQSVNLAIGIDGCHTVGFWLDLILPLPNVTEIYLTEHHCKSCKHSFVNSNSCTCGFSRLEALRVFSRDFQPVFPNVRAFGLRNWSKPHPQWWREETRTFRVLLQEMRMLTSLDLSEYFLNEITTRRLDDCYWMPLQCLALNASGFYPGVQVGALNVVARNYPELTRFEYVARYQRDNSLNIYRTEDEKVSLLTPLLGLPKLERLSLDTSINPNHAVSTAQMMAVQRKVGASSRLSEVHVTYRTANDWGSVPEPFLLFTNIVSLHSLQVSLDQPNLILDIISQMRTITVQWASICFLRKLKIDKTEATLPNAPQAMNLQGSDKELFSGRFLVSLIQLCPNLASIDASGICIHLCGQIDGPRPDPVFGENGFWGITGIVNAIKSSTSIKYVKINAKLDSVDALMSELPGNCGIFDVVERPLDCDTMGGCVLVPYKDWEPLSLLIVGPKENLNTFHLRIAVDNN